MYSYSEIGAFKYLASHELNALIIYLNYTLLPIINEGFHFRLHTRNAMARRLGIREHHCESLCARN